MYNHCLSEIIVIFLRLGFFLWFKSRGCMNVNGSHMKKPLRICQLASIRNTCLPLVLKHKVFKKTVIQKGFRVNNKISNYCDLEDSQELSALSYLILVIAAQWVLLILIRKYEVMNISPLFDIQSSNDCKGETWTE